MSTLTHAAEKYVTANGLRLHYVDWGNEGAPPMVLLHGLRAYGHWFDEFAEAARDRYRLLALDQRGRGESDWARDGDYTTDAYVADLEAFVDALKLERFVLGGHSMGGTNVINYAARHPDRLAALLILESAPELDPAGIGRIRRELAATPRDFDSWEAARAFLRTRHERPSDEHIRTRLRWMLKETPDGRITWRLDPAIFDPRLTPDPPARTWARLDKIRCPTLVVRGGLTDLVTVETVERMVATIPGSRWVEIPEAGHMVLEDNPPAFNAAVMGFLDPLGKGDAR